MESTLRIAGTVKESIVDGPGIRYVVFTQGCPHMCEGCHNPQTHSFDGGKLVDIQSIIKDIKKNPLIKGITISGGEPFLQANEVANLIENLGKGYNIIAYTGYEYEFLLKNSNENNGYIRLLNIIDILIDGKFDINLKSAFVPFRGSTNQRVIDVKKSLKIDSICLHEF